MSFSLLLAFDTNELEFVRGFEMGRLWALTEDGPPEPQMIRSVNAEMVLRIAEARGFVATSTDVDDTWIEVAFEWA